MKIMNGHSGLALHFEKHKGGSSEINGLARHDERQPGGHHSNKHIDNSRTSENVNLKPSNETLENRIKDTISRNRKGGLKGVRKDAVRYVETTVQLSGGILNQSESNQEDALRHAYDWLNERFGADNVVSAVIHKDETHMHLHLGFVPITEEGKLSAKTILSRGNLRQYQQDFLQYMQENKPAVRFKRGGNELKGLSQKQYEHFQKILDAKDSEVEHREDELDAYEDKLDTREEKIESERSKISIRENQLKTKELAIQQREESLAESIQAFNQAKQENQANNRRLRNNLNTDRQTLNQSLEQLQNDKNSLKISLNSYTRNKQSLDNQKLEQNKRSEQLDTREASITAKESKVAEMEEIARKMMSKALRLKQMLEEQARKNYRYVHDAIFNVGEAERKEFEQQAKREETKALEDTKNIFGDGLDDLSSKASHEQQR